MKFQKIDKKYVTVFFITFPLVLLYYYINILCI